MRLTESQIQTELHNIPSPITPADVREKQFARLDRNIDQASKTLVRIPGVDLPSDIRDRLNAQSTPAARTTGQYSGKPSQDTGEKSYKVGMRVENLGKTVSKVYADGTFDVQ